MVFPTGYSTNLGLISGIMRPGDWIIADQNSHASIVDGAILSKANVRFFRHNNPADLEKKLKQTTGKKLVAIEGVYSMDGDVCPLPELVEVAKKYGARILLDEAHSAFVYGANGRGVAEHFGLEDEVDIHIGTLLEGAGRPGRLRRRVAEPLQLSEGVRAVARVLVRALAGRRGGRAQERSSSRRRSRSCARSCGRTSRTSGAKLDEAGVDVGESTSQVIPIMVTNDRRVFELGHKLLRAGLYLQPVIYPAVAKHRSRFRVSISATHTTRPARRGRRDPRQGSSRRGDTRMSTSNEGYVQYHYRDAIGGFFEFPTENARAILPPELQPIEPHHGSSVLSVMAFDFTNSPVGDYGELILSILVAPRIEQGQPMPRSAFYPFRLGTTTRESREHAIERWHLPHYMQDIGDRVGARRRAHHHRRHRPRPADRRHDASPSTSGRTSSTRYQAFMNDEEGAYTSTIVMAGEFSENEEERGGITIHSQAMTDLLADWDVDFKPFRELWMRNGVADLPPAPDARELRRRDERQRLRHRQPRRRTGAGARRRRSTCAARSRDHGVTDIRFTTRDRRGAGDRGAGADRGRRAPRSSPCGGDGTWGNVANAIVAAGADVRLALIAAGTGNDFAKTMERPATDIDRHGAARRRRRPTSRSTSAGSRTSISSTSPASASTSPCSRTSRASGGSRAISSTSTPRCSQLFAYKGLTVDISSPATKRRLEAAPHGDHRQREVLRRRVHHRTQRRASPTACSTPSRSSTRRRSSARSSSTRWARART